MDVLTLVLSVAAILISVLGLVLNYRQANRIDEAAGAIPELDEMDVLVFAATADSPATATITSEVRNRGRTRIGVADVWLAFDELRPARLVWEKRAVETEGDLEANESDEISFAPYVTEPLSVEELAMLPEGSVASPRAVQATLCVRFGNGITLTQRRSIPPPVADQ